MLLLLGALHILSEHFAIGFLTSAHLWRSYQPSYLCLSHKWYTCANLTLFWDFRISVPWTKVSQPWPYCISEQIKFCCGGLSVPGKVCGLCPLDVSSTPSLVVTTKMSQDFANVLLELKSSLAENHCPSLSSDTQYGPYIRMKKM